MKARLLLLAGWVCFGPVPAASSGEFKLLPAGASPGAAFGQAMAWRDGLLVVGAPYDTGLTAHAGAVYVYAADGRSWRLTADDGSGAAGFGRAVATDGNLIVVGASGGAGRAYVYRFDGDGWVEEFRSQGGRAPGFAVAVSGDRFIASVSWRVDDGRLIGSGAAVFYRHDGEKWVSEFFDRTSFTSAFNSDGFGTAVALDGDTAAVSGHQKIRFYAHDGTAWRTVTTITRHGGSSLALEGDVLVAGAPGDSTQGTAAGAVHQFLRTDAGWAPVAKLLPPGRSTGARFGMRVALAGDALVVGAPLHSQGPEEIEWAGAAFLYRWQGTAWGLEATLFSGDRLTRGLGTSVAAGPDFVVAGAPQDDEAGSSVGAAHVFTPPWPEPMVRDGGGPPPRKPGGGRGRDP
jgi:hypothetical protein